MKEAPSGVWQREPRLDDRALLGRMWADIRGVGSAPGRPSPKRRGTSQPEALPVRAIAGLPELWEGVGEAKARRLME